jgi:hypothetical protein
MSSSTASTTPERRTCSKEDAEAGRLYRPYGGALGMWRCREREIILDGPAGTGKTRAALEKGYRCALKYAGARILLARKTRVSASESILPTFEFDVVPAGSPILHGASRRFRQRYDLENGSVVVVGGMDKANKILSSEWDMILVFQAEELTEDDWENLTTRLRNGVMPYQQIIGDANPGPPSHWLKRRWGSPVALAQAEVGGRQGGAVPLAPPRQPRLLGHGGRRVDEARAGVHGRAGRSHRASAPTATRWAVDRRRGRCL